MYFKTFSNKLFLLFMLMAILMPWQAKAQETLTVYDGTDANQYIPMYGYYFDAFTKSECILPASELTDMVDGTITGLTFYAKTVATTNSTWGTANQKVFIKEVTGTTLGGSFSGMEGATVVFDGLLTMPTTSSDGYTITFTEGYIYNGGNLLIGIYNDAKGKYNKVEWYGISGLSSGVSAYGNNGNSLSSCTYNAQSFLPKTTFTYEPASTGGCAKPKQFNASNITAHTATLTWTAGDEGQSNWEVYVTTDATIVPNDNTTPTYQVTECSKELSGLTAQTTYYVYVRSVCATDDMSNWANKTFTTTREALTVDSNNPYSQDFETSNDWGFENGSLTNSWCWGSAVNNGGEKSMYVSKDGGTTYEYAHGYTAIYASKLFSFAQGTYTFFFDWNAKGESTYDYLRVALAPGDVEFTAGANLYTGVGTSALPTGWIALDGGSKLNLSDGWQTQSAEAAVSGTYTMVFIWRNDGSGGTTIPAAIDNISISYMTCPRPTGLTANNIGGRTATLTWTENGTATNWVLQYATNNTFTESLTETNVSGTASTALTGLTPETKYYARVKSVLGTDESSWSDVKDFTTLATCAKPTLAFVSYSNTAYTGSVEWTGSTADAFEIAYRPTSDFDPSDMTLSDVTRVQLENVSEYTYTLQNLSPETKYYIYIQANCGAEDGVSVWSNRVTFTTTATCVAPSSLTQEGATSSSITLSWNKGADDQEAWQFRYKKTTDSDYRYLLVENHTSNSYTLTGLEPATDYHVNVRAYCSDEDQSKWCFANQTYDLTATTECAALTLPYTCDFEGAVETSGNFYNYPVPKCWTRIEYKYGSYNYTYYPYIYSSSSEAHNGTKSLRMYKTSASANETIILPAIDEAYNMSDLQIRFWAKSGSSNQTLLVGVMENDNFVQVEEVEGVNNTYAEYTVFFSEYTGNGRNIAIKCGSYDGYIYYYIDDLAVELAPSCRLPKNLTATVDNDHQATLTWVAGNTETEWNVQYKKASSNNWSNPVAVTETTYTLTGLKRATEYDVRVQAVCSVEDQSDWVETSFTTDCGICPINNTNALFEGFSESTFPPACWNWIRVSNYYGWQYSSGQYNPLDQQGAAYSYWPTGETYLILPQMYLDGAAKLSFDMVFQGDGTGQEAAVVLSTTGYSALDFTKTLWEAEDYPTSKTTVSIELSTYKGQNVYVAFKYTGVGTSGRTWYIDNVQVFVADNIFTTEGEWNNSNNWTNGMPTSSQSVHINAPATISNGTLAEVANITVGTGSITIAEGGQLKHNNEDVVATLQKSINGYTRNGNGWYFIAHPMSEAINVNSATSLISGTYDLYAFDESKDGEQWRNFELASNQLNTLEVATGYLYANSVTGNFSVTGTLNPSNTSREKALAYTSGKEFSGWNLVGNPFACNAYLVDAANHAVAYYRMNEHGDGYIAIANTTQTAIKPLEGVFVQATAANQTVRFTKEFPVTGNKHGNLNIILAQTVTARENKGESDNAIIRFDGGNTLEKLSFRDNTTKIFIPQNGKDYAVVNAESEGEMPVHFVAVEKGTYTLSFNADNVEFGYLHLIDNMTGADIDLLETSSYTFDAQTTDYASRFRLVFATGDNNDNQFAFISNGEIILNGINGNTNVQLFDVTGRMISSTNGANRISTENMASGVYMIRLVNGNNVKTQKIVIK